MEQLALLYIDDTPADAELMATLLQPHSIDVHSVFSGARGIEQYDPAVHSAVVIDWNLADMTGMEVAKELRQRYPQCPIMLISGLLENEHIAAAAQLGNIRCLEKAMHMEHIEYISEFVRKDAPAIKTARG